jgi:hypothetical protein
MELGWGKPLKAQIQGLDILGVRGLDQSLEEKLVNGITTVSWRARYFSLLPWAIGEFFEREKQAAGTTYNDEAFVKFVSRVELLTLAATAADPLNSDAGRGLGGDRYETELRMLRGGTPITFPQDAGEGLVNAYKGPCRALGILAAADESAIPHRLSPRGQEIWRARKASVSSEIMERLLGGSGLDKALVDAAVADFSLNAIRTNPNELAALTSALVEAWTPSEGNPEAVKAAYGRFAETMDWIRSWDAEGKMGGLALLAANYAAVAEQTSSSPTAVEWAHYEWRRRVHYALELLLSALCGGIFSKSAATVPEILDDWSRNAVAPQLTDWWPAAPAAWAMDTASAISSVSSALFKDQPIPVQALNRLPPGDKALAGYALLVALAQQSAACRSAGLFPNQESPGEQALAIVMARTGQSILETMTELFIGCVAPAHLTTTFRKISAGADCSLRFFPDGERFRSTGTETGAGQSGPRLLNVCRILADLELLGHATDDNAADAELVL